MAQVRFDEASYVYPGAARPERAVPYEPYGYPAYVVVRAQRDGDAVRVTWNDMPLEDVGGEDCACFSSAAQAAREDAGDGDCGEIGNYTVHVEAADDVSRPEDLAYLLELVEGTLPFELPGEPAFGVLSHVHDVEAAVPEPARFGLGREDLFTLELLHHLVVVPRRLRLGRLLYLQQ